MIVSDRDSSRQQFINAWEKYRNTRPLQPLENLICTVIQAHPEYQKLLTDPDVVEKDFSENPQNHNPFLHMGLHIALFEQLATDRPAGISSLYRTMLGKYREEHEVQHRMMECLEETLRQAQDSGTLPDEQAYLERIRMLK